MEWAKETPPGGGDRTGYRLRDEHGRHLALFFPSHTDSTRWFVSIGGSCRYCPMAEWPIEKLQALLTVEARLEGFK